MTSVGGIASRILELEDQLGDWCRHSRERWQDLNHDYGMGMEK